MQASMTQRTKPESRETDLISHCLVFSRAAAEEPARSFFFLSRPALDDFFEEEQRGTTSPPYHIEIPRDLKVTVPVPYLPLLSYPVMTATQQTSKS